jgi:hypothetical protein
MDEISFECNPGLSGGLSSSLDAAVSRDAETSLQDLIVRNMGICMSETSLLKLYCELSTRRATDRVGRFSRLLRPRPDDDFGLGEVLGVSRPNEWVEAQTLGGMFVLRSEQVQPLIDVGDCPEGDASASTTAIDSTQHCMCLYLIWQNRKNIDVLDCSLMMWVPPPAVATTTTARHTSPSPMSSLSSSPTGSLLSSIHSLTFTEGVYARSRSNKFSSHKPMPLLTLALTGLYPRSRLAAARGTDVDTVVDDVCDDDEIDDDDDDDDGDDDDSDGDDDDIGDREDER